MVTEIDWSGLVARSYGVPETLASQIERSLRDGSIPPGTRLPSERELAAQLGVSRSSIARAMQELALKGLLTRKPGRGTIALAPGVPANRLLGRLDRVTRDMREVADFRMVFEPHIAELAADRMTKSNLLELEELCSAEPSALSPEESTVRDERFHFVVAQGTHNALLVVLVETTSMWLHDVRLRAQFEPAMRERSWSQHRMILAAIERKSPGEAGRVMREHIQTFGAVFLC